MNGILADPIPSRYAILTESEKIIPLKQDDRGSSKKP